MQNLLATSMLAVVLAFALSFALLRVLRLPAMQRWFLDQPNARSLHTFPVPRTGGLGIVPAAVLGILAAGGDALLVVLAIGLMLLSLLDDWKNLPAAWRLFVHLVAATIFALAYFPAAGWIGLPALVLAVGWLINLYNFMDGADGLAGGMTVVGFCTYAAAAGLVGDAPFALVNLCVAAAAAAFLTLNFPPARIFMGDAGSVPLGFLAAALGLIGWRDGLWPLWFPLVVFAPFMVDASVTLVRRALRGERVWTAHRGHYYQRLVLTGWSHRQLALAEYGLMLLGSGAALAALNRSVAVQVLTLGSLTAVYVLACRAVDRRWQVWRRGSSNQK